MGKSIFDSLNRAAHSAGFQAYGPDFLCRVLAILYCYGGGPGGEYFRVPLAHDVAMHAGRMLDNSIRSKNWEFLKLYRKYVKELQENRAEWISRTLDKLNIPANVMQFSECVQPKSPRGS